MLSSVDPDPGKKSKWIRIRSGVWSGSGSETLIKRHIDSKWFQGDQDPLGHRQPPRRARTSYVHQYLTWHMFIHCFSKTNRFKMVPASYRVLKMLSDTFSDLLKLNHSTCCTRHGWASPGRGGCPRASWSPWNHFKSICRWIIGYQQCAISIFDEHNWYLLRSPRLTLTRSLRVSKSILITLYHAGTVLNSFVFEK